MDTSFRGVTERLRRAVKKPLKSDESDVIIRYFQIHTPFEARHHIVPVTDDFEFLDEERFENLYKSWDSDPPQACRSTDAEPAIPALMELLWR
jgi:hypothetical protein